MSHRPLLAWTVAFVAGIGLAGYAGLAALTILAGLCLVFLAAFALRPQFVPALRGPVWSMLLSPAVGLMFVAAALGALRYEALQIIPASDISRLATRPVQAIVAGTICSEPEIEHGRASLFVSVRAVTTGFRRSAATGVVAVAVAADDPSVLPFGEPVTVDGLLQPVASPSNAGEYSWREYLARRGVYCEITAKRPGAIQPDSERSDANIPARVLFAGRLRMVGAIDAVLRPDDAAMLSGILFGQRRAIPAALTAELTETGTVHVLATAGLHVAILSYWMLLALRFVTAPRKAALTAVIALLWAYAEIAGERPAVVRAVLMASFYFGALILEREPDAATSLGAAALVILALQPAQLFDPGFEMSFLTVGTLVAALPIWNTYWLDRLNAFPHRFWTGAVFRGIELIGVCLFAQIGSAPITASAYNQVSMIGPIANLIIVPLMALVVPLGMAGSALGALSPAIGAPFLRTAGFGVWAMRLATTALSGLSWSYLAVPAPNVATLALYYGCLWTAAGAIRRHQISSVAKGRVHPKIL